MGQKTHPVGLRLGLHRKWSSSWLTTNTKAANPNYSSVVSIRGGLIRSNREDILCAFLRRFPDPAQTRPSIKSDFSDAVSSSETNSVSSELRFFVTPIDLQIVVGSGGILFIVFIYNKFQGRTQ